MKQPVTRYTGRTISPCPANAHPFNRNRNRAVFGTDELPNKNFPAPKKWNQMTGAERKAYLEEKKAREETLERASQQAQTIPATLNPEAGGAPEPAPSDLPDVEEIQVG